jgi:hypothetical protein
MICNLLAGTAVFAAGKATKVQHWKNVETLDVAKLKNSMEGRVRQTIGVRCTFRGKDIRHMKPNWYQGSLWQANPNGKGFADVQVLVAKKDLPAFKAITTDAQSSDFITVYGEVLRDFERKFLFVQLFGRNAAVDAEDNATVTW